ncbi:MAG TPA: DUF2007 domain-containing protein [Armatimonadota bacterium]|nr:DUF2007 domain-containing protein [Armatimonadota bacterium]HPP73857.1 DUF2007 domain-containing protein [Armatimonadota bacterium]
MNQEPLDGVKIVPVYRAQNESVADIVRGLLESENIQVTFRSQHAPSVYDGLFTVADGYWADLMVREDQADRAREIIHAFESSDDALDTKAQS